MGLNKSVLCYADGDADLGLGHLYRLISIYTNYHQKVDFVFVNKNDTQAEIYNKFSCPTIDFYNLRNSSKEYDIGIYDSKKRCNYTFLDIKKYARTWISIDSTRPWTKDFDFLVYPSFYVDKNDLPKNISASGSKKYFGKDYVLFKSSINEIKQPKINTLVTFGGSDPNNLTELVCNIVHDKEYYSDFTFLIGPKFKKSVSYFVNKFPKLKFIDPVTNTFPLIKASNIVLTAIGITLQECEYSCKKTLIISNHKDDIHDIDKIKRSSSNPMMYFHLGYFKDIDEDIFNKTYNFFIDEKILYNERKNKWGNGWDELFNLIG